MPKLPKITITPVDQVLAKQFLWKLEFIFTLIQELTLERKSFQKQHCHLVEISYNRTMAEMTPI